MLFYLSLSLHGKQAFRSSDSETDTDNQKHKVVISTVQDLYLRGAGAFLEVKFTPFPRLISDVHL